MYGGKSGIVLRSYRIIQMPHLEYVFDYGAESSETTYKTRKQRKLKCVPLIVCEIICVLYCE